MVEVATRTFTQMVTLTIDGENAKRTLRQNITEVVAHHALGRPPTRRKKMECLASAFGGIVIGFQSRFSQCVDYMRFNEKSFCFRWQETTKLMLFGNTKTSSLVILCDLRYLAGNISSVMTKHMSVQRKLHRFAYLIVKIISWFYVWRMYGDQVPVNLRAVRKSTGGP